MIFGFSDIRTWQLRPSFLLCFPRCMWHGVICRNGLYSLTQRYKYYETVTIYMSDICSHMLQICLLAIASTTANYVYQPYRDDKWSGSIFHTVIMPSFAPDIKDSFGSYCTSHPACTPKLSTLMPVREALGGNGSQKAVCLGPLKQLYFKTGKTWV